jgi:hypothetical protein
MLESATDLGVSNAYVSLRRRSSLVLVCLVALLGGLIGWYVRDSSEPQARLPEHQVLGTVSSVDATGLCLQPDDINTPKTCASTVAVAPQPLTIPTGTRMLGSYSVFPSGDNAPGVFIWVMLQQSH